MSHLVQTARTIFRTIAMCPVNYLACIAMLGCTHLITTPSLFAQDSPNKDSGTNASKANDDDRTTERGPQPSEERRIAVFGGGCFWCIEAVFERVWGVNSVVSGYSGGAFPNPNYQQVLSGQTGHAEVCRIEYDPSVISYEELLMIFFKSHDPTSLNAQGPDFGTQYRSVIFYNDPEELSTIEKVLEGFKKKRTFRGRVVTEVAPLKNFFMAEEYHQDYFEKHPEKPYCEINIRPKIGKFERGFKDNSKLQKSKELRKKQ